MHKIAELSKKLSGLTSLSLLSVVLAQQENISLLPPAPYTGLQDITVPGIISMLIKLILVVAALVAFIFLVVGGIKWITSGGDKEQTAKAQGTITAALIGLVIVFSAWAILRLLETFFGVSIFRVTVPAIPTNIWVTRTPVQ
jgi:uncharacterized membrane protein